MAVFLPLKQVLCKILSPNLFKFYSKSMKYMKNCRPTLLPDSINLKMFCLIDNSRQTKLKKLIVASYTVHVVHINVDKRVLQKVSSSQ